MISIYSGAYQDSPVDRWSTDWDHADYVDIDIAGNATKAYRFTGQEWNGAAIEFTSEPIDASAMNFISLDVWIREDVTIEEFKVKLVDFGSNAVYFRSRRARRVSPPRVWHRAARRSEGTRGYWAR